MSFDPVDFSNLSNDEVRKLVKPRTARPVSLSTHNRFTVRGSVLFQSVEEDPTEYPLSYSVFLQSKNEPYSRVFTVSEEPARLDLGWLGNNCSLVIIENRAALPVGIKPTPEEVEALATKVLRVSCEGMGLLVRPGFCQYFEPEDVTKLVLQSLAGEVRTRVSILPK